MSRPDLIARTAGLDQRGIGRGRMAVAGMAFGCMVMGCVRKPVYTSPSDIFRGVPKLRERGRATVDTVPDGTADIAADQKVEIAFRKCELFGLVCDDNKRTVTIAQLIENCPDVAPFREDTYRPDPPCLLLSTTSEKIEVESHLRPNWLFWETMGGAVVAVAIFGVVLGLVDPEPGGT